MDKDVWARFSLSGPRLETQRHSFRLLGHDYAQAGAYYLTICTHERQCLFGEITGDVICLNAWGRIAEEEWQQSSQMRSELELDAFVVMPNHLHGIVVISPDQSTVGAHGVRPASEQADEGAPGEGAPGEGAPGEGAPGEGARRAPLQRAPRSLGAFVAGFKSAVTRRINDERGTQGIPIWQRNYHERIIRSEDNWRKARLYIANNPARWHDDINNPAYEPPAP